MDNELSDLAVVYSAETMKHYITVKHCSFSLGSCHATMEHCYGTERHGECKLEQFDVTMEVKRVRDGVTLQRLIMVEDSEIK